MTPHFWEGFEKRALSLTGMKAGLRSGKRNYSSFGQITRSQPKAGVVEAPRAVKAPLPTPTPIKATTSMAPRPSGRMPAMPQVPKPAKQSSRGVSSTTI